MRSLFYKTFIFLFSLLLLMRCSENEDFSNLLPILEVSTGLEVETSYITNQPITFSVFNESGEDLTNISIFYIDGTQNENNEIIHSNEGNHSIYAEYFINGQLYTTESKNYSVVNPETKLLLEDFTGTWCGYCPPVKYAIEQALEMYPNKITVVATHQNDQFAISQEEELINGLGPFGLPEARINRAIEWVDPYELNQLDSYLNDDNNIAISIDSNIENEILQIKVRFVSRNALNNHKLVVYLLEDGLIADQSNYLNFDETSYFYNLGNPIVDYEHNDVLRHTFTNILGDQLGNIEPYEDVNNFYNIDLSANNFQTENLRVIAFITDSENLTINSQHASVGEFQDFN